MNPLVTVVIPTFGRPEKLLNALESVFAQTLTNWEVVIVDDNPPESPARQQTASLIGQFSNDIRLRYVPHDTNKGACAARNTGMNVARGKYIAFLDDDDIWYKEKLEKQTALLESENAQVCYCDMYLSYNGRRKRYNNRILQDPYRTLLIRGFGICTSALVVARSALISIGGFDNSLRSMQDYDLLIRLAKDFKILELREVLLVYQLGVDGISCNLSSKIQGHQGIINKYRDEYIRMNLKVGLSRQLESLADFLIRNGERRSSFRHYMDAIRYHPSSARIYVKFVFAVLFGKKPLEYFLLIRQRASSRSEIG